jgi:hypothetical protein
MKLEAKQRLQASRTLVAADDGEASGPFEAHGVKGMKNTPWRKTFKSYAAMEKWLEANDAECYGTRDLEAAKRGKLMPGF